MSSGSDRIAFLIITALPEERDAVLERLPGHRPLPPVVGEASVYYRTALAMTHNNGTSACPRRTAHPPIGNALSAGAPRGYANCRGAPGYPAG